MPTAPSKYSQNQFQTATRERSPLMSDVLNDALDKIATARSSNAAFNDGLLAISAARADWHAGMTAPGNAEAARLAAHRHSLAAPPEEGGWDPCGIQCLPGRSEASAVGIRGIGSGLTRSPPVRLVLAS